MNDHIQLICAVGLTACNLLLFLSGERNRRRAEWFQMYAAQLERELEIPPEQRADKDSWRQAGNAP